MRRRVKLELMLAVAVSVTVALLAVAVNMPAPERSIELYSGWSGKLQASFGGSDQLATQQVTHENIQGELIKGDFETTIQGLRNVTSSYGGHIPVLHMSYENDLWSGTLTCNVPEDNVTSFTFDVRLLISDHGKVTRISIDVTETEVNASQTAEVPVSEVGIYLRERTSGSSPFVDMFGGIVPVLTTSLVWVAGGLIVGVPLCFAMLGVVMLVDRGIIPVWKRQFRNRSRGKGMPQTISD